MRLEWKHVAPKLKRAPNTESLTGASGVYRH